MNKQYINPSFPHILHGGDYNPDQWQDRPDILEEDMRLFRLANCNSLSVGIFSWAALEPEEGKFDFTFLDKAMDDIYKNGGRAVLATPSGARPAWLSMKYPEVLRTNSDGSRNTHGKRHNHCYTSPVYREKMTAINRRIAERYKDHPALLVWHLSNEYGGKCYCENCKAAFRLWLKEKYGSIEAVNKAWWTAFWAHTYTSFEQIDPPMDHGETYTNGLDLDWKRFCTHQTTDFMKAEIRAVREFTPHIPVTTNMMGFYTGLDYRVLSEELDVIANDMYPHWRGGTHDAEVAVSAALTHDLCHSMQHKSFMLMESTPSNVDWQDYNKLKRPGVHELASLQAVAHGADTVQYFQWRKGRGGGEQFHGAVVDHEGSENTRVFREVSTLGARLKKLDAVAGTKVHARVALLHDWDSQWALEDSKGMQNRDKKYSTVRKAFYKPLWKRGINADVISSTDDFSRYDLILAPMLYLVSEETGKKIAEYVAAGGRILATYTTAMVNEYTLAHLGGFPGAGLRKVFGIWNEELDVLYPDETNTVMTDNRKFTAVDYCELLHAEGAEVLATYASDFYAGRPAATVNRYGKGKAYYIAFRDNGDFADVMVEKLLAECGITSDFDGPLPDGVTAHSRTDGENTFVFLQNFNHAPAATATAKNWVTVEENAPISGDIALKPLETLILKSVK